MKKLAALMLGMSLLFGSAVVAFGKTNTAKSRRHKKPHKKKAPSPQRPRKQ